MRVRRSARIAEKEGVEEVGGGIAGGEHVEVEWSGDTTGKEGGKEKVYQRMPVVEGILGLLMISVLVWVVTVLGKNADTDLVLFGGCMVGTEVFVFLSRFLFKIIGAGLSRWAYRNKLVPSPPLDSQGAMAKWLEQSWQLTVHTTFFCAEYYLIFLAPRSEYLPKFWEFEDLENLWRPDPWSHEDLHKSVLKYLYIAQMAVWIYTAGMHVFYDKRRKDYQVMLTHHVVTVALLIGSYELNYLRVGVLVLYINDATDVFIDILKMANYIKFRGPNFLYMSEIFFVFMTSAMVYFRVWHGIFRINYATGIIPHKIFFKEGVTKPTVWEEFLDHTSFTSGNGPDYYRLMNALLWILTALHIYWILLMFRILYVILLKDTASASREEYEGDSDEEDEDEDSTESYVFATTISRFLWPKKKSN